MNGITNQEMTRRRDKARDERNVEKVIDGRGEREQAHTRTGAIIRNTVPG